MFRTDSAPVFWTDSSKITLGTSYAPDPVQGRDAKKHTTSSGTSPYRPQKGGLPGYAIIHKGIAENKNMNSYFSSRHRRVVAMVAEMIKSRGEEIIRLLMTHA